jgi:hypothetical protein
MQEIYKKKSYNSDINLRLDSLSEESEQRGVTRIRYSMSPDVQCIQSQSRITKSVNIIYVARLMHLKISCYLIIHVSMFLMTLEIDLKDESGVIF